MRCELTACTVGNGAKSPIMHHEEGQFHRQDRTSKESTFFYNRSVLNTGEKKKLNAIISCIDFFIFPLKEMHRSAKLLHTNGHTIAM